MEKQETLLESLAQKNSMTVEEMHEQLEKRLVAGLNDSDPEHRAQWKRIPCVGEIPTVEEWLAYIIKRVYEEGEEELFKRYLME